MFDNKVQVAEFAFPFPSKIFEKELLDKNIDFKIFNKPSAEGGADSCVFFVSQSDFEIASEIREKVDKENADAEQKYRHPFVKVIGYVGLLPVLYYLIKKILEIFENV